MCGVVGIAHFGRVADAPTRVASMAASIIHRGPDDDGFWYDENVALGFRRLAIVDLETGAQPMANEDDSVQVIFNGEIYNHRQLRQELVAAGHVFQTDHSDTEVIVHGYEEWGENLPKRLNGMFAFAVWDRRKRELFIARDRLGIKPLYFGKTAQGLIFSSDICAIHRSGLVESKPNPDTVFEYFQQQNVWAGRSMFAGVQMLEPGSWLRIDPQRHAKGKFWEIDFCRRSIRMEDAAERLREAIKAALERQIAADVPVMAYLSGGIDSSSIVAGAHRLDPKINAYSCIFDLKGVGEDRVADEREYSRALAEFLHIPHVELELPTDELRNSLFDTVAALEEPRMGMAYVNYCIAKRVARDSKVVLSGCGGDEILAGYVGRYAALRDRFFAPKPPATILSRMRNLLVSAPSHRQQVLDAALPLYSYPVASADIDAAFTSEFRRSGGDYSVRDGLSALIAEAPSDNIWDILMYIDLRTYLHGLLVVEDKVSMAHSLETRVPLLDNEIIDLSLSYDLSLLTDGVVGKKVFREAIRDWVPSVIADKPKMGFGPPDASWYRGLLRPFIQRILDPVRIRRRGVFEPTFVARAVEEHMEGRANRVPFLWSALSFEAWCEATGFYGGDLGTPVTRG